LYCFLKRCFVWVSGTAAIAVLSSLPLTAQTSPPNRNSLTSLPDQEQVSLRAGEAVVTGSQGNYIGRILISAPVNTTWDVLTDYDRFQDFLPGVVSSRILTSQGNTTVFEQVNQVRVLLFQQTNRIVITAVKQYPQKIEFQLKEGAIKSLQGNWALAPVAPNQVLITQRVTFDPGNAGVRDLAFVIYKSTLLDSLKAIKRETERRVSQR
jgi:ribosome-associated toxin RatA of RatAB toxin-antitoxin module